MKFHLETDRLILREIRKTDINGMFELDSDEKVHKYLGKKPINTILQAEENIQFIHQQYKELGIGRFACIEKATGQFIGWSGLKHNTGEKEKLNGHKDFVDIGYRFIPRFWRKGYASETAFACLKFGFKEMNYDTIYGAADIENVGSNKILRKIGLQFVNQFNYKEVKVNWYELKKANYGK
ncbi:GNAT family N-acetyltransferase [Tenacibaculum haliotis]|uniref:GNAT family N-acetyltransferase n=1 Tax=Tenacibaculum haliotis TaxID=1888914 RepID=UPI0021AF331C|nr:GNAT family N-acetyltransferase [Tenacibaculum haliotis]MCT4698110.1 GNAT family N-acetyltransferase [Tenacibaculum haliotis]